MAGLVGYKVTNNNLEKEKCGRKSKEEQIFSSFIESVGMPIEILQDALMKNGARDYEDWSTLLSLLEHSFTGTGASVCRDESDGFSEFHYSKANTSL